MRIAEWKAIMPIRNPQSENRNVCSTPLAIAQSVVQQQ